MFRIDRRLVKITVPKARAARMPSKPKAGGADAQEELKQEVGVEGESPEAATSAENMESADDLVKSLMQAADDDMEAELQRMIEAAKEEAAKLVESEKVKADSFIDDAYEEVDKVFAEADKKLEEAEQIKEEAQKKLKEAEKALLDARDEAADIRKRAYDEGFAEGKREGEEAGLKIYEEKLQQQRQEDETELKNVLNEIAQERERISSELEEDTVALAIEIVRKIINPAEKQLGNVFTSLIKNALRQMSSDSKFVLRVSPNEYERFFSSGAGEIKLDSGTVVTMTVLKDVALEEGDLIIDTDEVTVNAGVNTQLRYVELAFSEARREDER